MWHLSRWRWVWVALAVVGCSADPTDSRDEDSDGRAVGRPATPDPAGEYGDRDEPYVCAAEPTQPCYCPGGEAQGTQACTSALDGAGTVGPCAGCPVLEAPAADRAAALCPELRTQAGCMATTYRSEELPASVLLLVDRSGSMLCNAPPVQPSSDCGIEPADPAMPSKWDITVDALGATFGDLSGGNVNAALSFFSVDDGCAAATAPAVALAALGPAHAGRLDDELGAQTPDGRTPIVSALINAYRYLHWEARPGCQVEPCGAPGNRFVVLLTDGAESCASADEQRRLLTETVPNARDANIRTFVIGAPGSEPARGFLSELAFRGGTAKSDMCTHDEAGLGTVGDCHFDMTETADFAGDLLAALGDIGGSVGCSFAVSGTGSVNVQYRVGGGDPMCVPQSDTLPCEGGAEGWQFARNADGTADTTRVSICGSACSAIRADLGAQVDVVLGCTTIEGPK